MNTPVSQQPQQQVEEVDLDPFKDDNEVIDQSKLYEKAIKELTPSDKDLQKLIYSAIIDPSNTTWKDFSNVNSFVRNLFVIPYNVQIVKNNFVKFVLLKIGQLATTSALDAIKYFKLSLTKFKNNEETWKH